MSKITLDKTDRKILAVLQADRDVVQDLDRPEALLDVDQIE